MRKLSQGAQLVLALVVLSAVAAGGYVFAIAPTRASAAEAERRTDATRAQVAARRAAAAAPGAALAPAVDAAELFRLTKAMPDDADMPEAIIELDRIAADTGIVFDAITPRAPVAGEGYQIVPIDLSFQGDFYSLSDFLFRLRSLVAVRDGRLAANGRLLEVESVSFAAGPASFPQLTASVLVNAYVFGGEPAATAAPAAPAPEPQASAPEPVAAGAS